ncbi:2-oxo acid dehydrogenase subunit E2, partial [Candidatus Igneacidithiobacillus taiwanensis]
MKQPILMPVLSDTMQTGRLTRWNKSVGDPVHKGEAIAEVETDKAILDVEAFADGFLAGPLAPVEEDIPVRQPIAYLVDSPAASQAAGDCATLQNVAASTGSAAALPQASASTAAPPTAATAPESPTPTPMMPESASASVPPSAPPETPRPAPAASSARNLPHSAVRASPYAKGLARDLGLDIEQISPGPDGQIHAREVLAAALAPRPIDLRYGPPHQIGKPSVLREAVARNMLAAAAIPSFRISTRVDLDPLHSQGKKLGLSFTLALTRACALTVAEDPWFNGVWTPTGWVSRSRVDVGIAVDTGAGLITPVLR